MKKYASGVIPHIPTVGNHFEVRLGVLTPKELISFGTCTWQGDSHERLTLLPSGEGVVETTEWTDRGYEDSWSERYRGPIVAWFLERGGIYYWTIPGDRGWDLRVTVWDNPPWHRMKPEEIFQRLRRMGAA